MDSAADPVEGVEPAAVDAAEAAEAPADDATAPAEDAGAAGETSADAAEPAPAGPVEHAEPTSAAEYAPETAQEELPPVAAAEAPPSEEQEAGEQPVANDQETEARAPAGASVEAEGNSELAEVQAEAEAAPSEPAAAEAAPAEPAEPAAEDAAPVETASAEPVDAEAAPADPAAAEAAPAEPGTADAALAEAAPAEPAAAEAAPAETAPAEAASSKPAPADPAPAVTEAAPLQPSASQQAGAALPSTTSAAQAASVPASANAANVVDDELNGSADDSVAAIDENFFYDATAVATPSASPIAVSSLTLHHSFGFEGFKRNNVHYITDSILVYATGNVVHLFNVNTGEQSYITGIDGGGIGAIAVHPSRRYFAVGEKGKFPNIYIYEYPSLKLYRVLRRGTDRAYSDLTFNADGSKLASVGSAPDYMLTVWNWKLERTILRSKAFSQEIFRVTFSPVDDGQLVTSGTGHIRFWKMAKTFTGLKLQGLIGKFGNVELSDIAGYAQLPDGKVLSGAESGNLLLWDGNLIKVEITGKEGKPCHDGAVEVVHLDGHTIVTAGLDGNIRMWDGETIDNAELTDDKPRFEMEPVNSVEIGKGVQIKGILKGKDHWVVQNAGGSILQVDFTGQSKKEILSFHAGAISALDVSPVANVAASTGDDGTVRLFNFVDKHCIYTQQFNASGTSLVWVPKSVDVEGKTIAVGFKDGVVRVLETGETGFRLKRAFKPHSSAVLCLAFSGNGRRLVTGAADGTVFFLSVWKNFAPIGFVQLSSAIRSLCWSDDSSRVLVLTVNGEVLELVAPSMSKVDVTKTYEIEVEKRAYTFVRPPPPAVAAPEAGEQAADSAKAPEDAAKASEQASPGLDPVAAAPAPAAVVPAATQPEGAEGEQAEPVPEEPLGKVVSAVYGSHGQFLLACDGADAGKIYLCTFDEDKPARALDASSVISRTLKFSASHRFLLMGAMDGSVQVRWVSAPERYWHAPVHDSINGHVADVALSFDDQYLLSVGQDGSFFVYRVAAHEFLAAPETEGVVLRAPEPRVDLVDSEDGEQVVPGAEEVEPDITDSKQYSIQEDKLKTEHDKLVAAAELKKEGVRKYIQELREEFLKLVEANERAHPKERLSREELELDPDLRVMLEQEAAEKVKQARLELAWISEKKEIALRKLRKKFLDDIAVERIELLGFKNEHSVTSFRTPHLSATLKANMMMVHNLIRSEENARPRQSEIVDRSGQYAESTASMPQDGARAQAHAAVSESHGGPSADGNASDGESEEKITNATLSKAEAKKQQREKRAREWEELMAAKPDDKYEDPADVAAIAWAEKNMGDYKLKTDDDYVVPESQRVNAEKKRRQMILLEESIHSIKMGFNERFLALRDLKKRICENIAKDNARIREINATLQLREDLFEAQMQPCEFPENRDKYDKETLLRFEKKQAKAAAKEVAKKGGGGGGGFGGFGGGGGGSGGGGDDAAVDEMSDEDGSPQTQQAPPETAAAPKPLAEEEDLSELEKAEAYVYKRRLQFEKECIIQKIEKTVATFDEALDELRREKFKLEADLKTTDMKMLLLYQELVLLKEFEKKDTTLAKKLEAKRLEKAEIVAKIAECQDRLAVKKTEIEALLEKDKAILAEFNQVVGENNKFYEQLLKIFKKKIKRLKKKQKEKAEGEDGEDEDYDDEDEEYEDDEDVEMSDEEGGGGEEEDACPPGCDQHLYDKVCELRERRLDHEELLADFQKSIEGLRKENEALVKKEKLIDQGLHGVENDIQAFQTEKQRKLNELHVVITLKMHQIQCLLDGHLPDDLSQCLVFTNAGLKQLRDRIRQLKEEKQALRRQQKELRKQHVQLTKSKKAKEAKISELEARAYDVQMLKFGQVIDLEQLERMSVNRTAEELKEKLKRQEMKNAAELELWESKVRKATDQLAEVTRRNTELLQRVAELSQKQSKLESALNSTQNTLVAEFAPSASKENAERQRLMELVKLQAREIDALKAEIQMLRRKGGQVYSPAQNRRQFS